MRKVSKEKPVAKETEKELDIFQLLEKAKEQAPLEEERLKGEINERIEKLNRLRNLFGGNQVSLQDGFQTLKKPQGAAKVSTPKVGLPPMPDGPPPEGTDKWKYCSQHGWGNHDGRKHRSEVVAANKAKKKETQLSLPA